MNIVLLQVQNIKIEEQKIRVVPEYKKTSHMGQQNYTTCACPEQTDFTRRPLAFGAGLSTDMHV